MHSVEQADIYQTTGRVDLNLGKCFSDGEVGEGYHHSRHCGAATVLIHHSASYVEKKIPRFKFSQSTSRDGSAWNANFFDMVDPIFLGCFVTPSEQVLMFVSLVWSFWCACCAYPML